MILVKNVSILVIKIKIHNNKVILGNSKPCLHCLYTMKNIAPMKGYRITTVYYSNDKGVIIKSSLKKLLKEEHYISRGNKK